MITQIQFEIETKTILHPVTNIMNDIIFKTKYNLSLHLNGNVPFIYLFDLPDSVMYMYIGISFFPPCYIFRETSLVQKLKD